jgi:uncharacterized lipoprotein YddW (UPF0748 family)
VLFLRLKMNFGAPGTLCGWVMIALAPALATGAVEYERVGLAPPAVSREFRGVWIATVANIDWPSRPGLSTAEQKAQLIRILDRAVELRLNAVVFQVRPACDAMYASAIEPWSEYLTGHMGRAPVPLYDPLAFAVDEAHKRGLELHAWFNPYRARHFTGKSPAAANHISRTHPELVKRCGKYLWLDPGEVAVRDYSLSVVMDVVRRYDIDGVHFDDYFYPDRTDLGAGWDFPDDESWAKFGGSARRNGISREDWRRENVNTFIARVYQSIKGAKPWVKFGISPRGIWRPGYPRQVKGLDAYVNLYADSRRWLANGWLDYFSPQLYWPVESIEQSFPALLDWWAAQNPKGRHLWPGLNVARADQWPVDEIPSQIRLARKEPGVTGYLCYSASSLMGDSVWTEALRRQVNREPALVPASPWLSTNKPGKPALFLSGFHSGDLRLMLGKPSQRDQTRWWLIQTRSQGDWKTEILPGWEQWKHFGNTQPDVIAVSLIDRCGFASPAVVFEKKEPMPATRRRPYEARGSN